MVRQSDMVVLHPVQPWSLDGGRADLGGGVVIGYLLHPFAKRRLVKAEQARKEARQAYLLACDRGDTRDQHTTHERFVKATVECLRLAL